MEPHQRNTKEADRENVSQVDLWQVYFQEVEEEQVDFIVFINWASVDSGRHTRAHRDRRHGGRGGERKQRHTP